MSTSVALPVVRRRPRVRTQANVARGLLIGIALAFLGLLVVAPVATVFVEAFRDGIGAYLSAIAAPDALAAIGLTLLTAAIAVPVNTLFGLAAAWAIARFEFRGKRLFTTAVDLPLAVSPVVSGMIFVLLFGTQGLLGNWLAAHDVRILFAVPAIVLATAFVTVPYVARELVPFLQSRGIDEEEAALTLGASGWQTFFKVTLPNLRWALLFGVVLCNARAMGEFGAVSVVSGRVRGVTNTIPLHVEVLYDEYQFSGAFAVSSLLVLLAVGTLVLQHVVRARTKRKAR